MRKDSMRQEKRQTTYGKFLKFLELAVIRIRTDIKSTTAIRGKTAPYTYMLLINNNKKNNKYKNFFITFSI